MAEKESVSRYSLIINKLRKKPSSLTELNDLYIQEKESKDNSLGFSKINFEKDANDIRLLYGIDIQYDSSEEVYYISDEKEPNNSSRLLETFDTFNALNLTKGLSKYVYFEKRKPQGTEHFYSLLHAIKNHFAIQFNYQKFLDEQPSQRTAEPYALKEFKGRWYVITNDTKDSRIKTFALDRISDIKLSKNKFQWQKDLDVDAIFKNCFGIISATDGKPEKIILSFEPLQGKYIKSFPLHETQQVIVDNIEELKISLQLYITHDFIMELLSYGEEVEVISPNKLIEQIKGIYKNALGYYE